MRTTKSNRVVGALIATAVIIAGCSGSDDDAVPTTDAAPQTTTTAVVPQTTDGGPSGAGLQLGLLAPSPGLLADLFRGQVRGTDFAAADVDDAGGVLGGPLTVISWPGEPGGDMVDTVPTAVDAGAQALIGPVGSDGALEVREEIASLGSIACSASATLPRITLEQDTMSLFRTALPDDITTTYLADAIVDRRDAEAAGATWEVAIVGRTDEYGLSISSGLAATLEAAGLVPNVIGYDPRRVNFAGIADEVVAAAPDLTVLVTYAEGGNLLSSLTSAGLDPATMIGLDAFFAPRIADIATPGGDAAAVDGFTVLGSMGDKAFLDRLYDDDSNGQVANAPQAYDCAVTLALAAAAADSATSVADAVRDVTDGGVTCSTYADCLEKLEAGEDIDYDGVSGQLAIDDNGDPTFARFTTAVLRGGAISGISSTDVDIAEIRRQQAAHASAAQITKIQQALTFLGFYTGPINGLDTTEFRAGLAAFQTSVGLPPTGVFDEATDAALRAALGTYADLLATTTADIQRLLADLGFYTGPIDGVWTDELAEAIRSLQAELGVQQTGVLDAATLRAIYAAGQESATTATTVAPAPTTPATPTTAPATTSTTVAPPTTPTTTAPPTTVAPETTTTPTTVAPIEPPAPTLPSLFEVLDEAGNFTTFLRIVEATGYESDLETLNQYTVFAPNDAAFEGVDVDGLIADFADDPDGLLDLVADYVTPGRKEIELLTNPIVMLSGRGVELADDGAAITVGGARVVSPSLRAFNGIVHELEALYSIAPR